MARNQFATHLLLLAGLTAAGAAPPAKIANEWGGHDHQPTRGDVRAAERALGIGPTARQKEIQDKQLDAIQRQLLQAAQSSNLSRDR